MSTERILVLVVTLLSLTSLATGQVALVGVNHTNIVNAQGLGPPQQNTYSEGSPSSHYWGYDSMWTGHSHEPSAFSGASWTSWLQYDTLGRITDFYMWNRIDAEVNRLSFQWTADAVTYFEYELWFATGLSTST